MPLPEVTRTVTVQPTGVVRSSGAASRLFGEAAATAEGFLREARAERQAEEVADAALEGANAVIRDESGRLIFQPRDNSTAANRAFNRSAVSRYLAEFEIDNRNVAAEMRTQFRDDPAGFEAAFSGRMQGALEEVPSELRGPAMQILNGIGGEQYRGLINAKATQDEQLALNAWRLQTAQLEDDLFTLAMTGGVDTPVYLDRASQLEQRIQDGLASGFLNEDEANLRREMVADDGMAAAVAGDALRVYEAAGGGVSGQRAAQKRLDQILTDPDLTIPEERRHTIVNRTQQMIREREALRKVDTSNIRKEFAGQAERVRLGYDADIPALVGMADRAAAAGDPELAIEIRDTAAIAQEVQGAARLPIDDLVAAAREADAVARENTTDVNAARRAAAYAEAAKTKAKALSDDAFTYGIEAHGAMIGPVQPLDFEDVGSLGQQLRDRAAAVDFIEEYEGIPVQPMSKDEIGRLSNLVAILPAAEKSALMGQIAEGVGARRLPRLMGELTEKSETQRVFASAAGLAEQNPALGREIMAGEDAMKANPKLLPKDTRAPEETFDRLYANALSAIPQARRALLDTTMRLYAKQMNDKGDHSGEFDEGVFEDALRQVVGEPVEWNGQAVVAPRRGMDQGDFDDLMDGLTDGDLGTPPVTARGERLTAEMIRRWGTLRTVGDGRYTVTIGGFDLIDPVTGRRWMLDLSGVPIRDPSPDLPAISDTVSP